MQGRSPISVRNNNPGNLERSTFQWLGLAQFSEMTPEQRAEPRYLVFRTPVYGFRALALDLRNSWKAGRRTIGELLARFAPAGDNNDTRAYVDDVTGRTGIASDAELDLNDASQLELLCIAIAIHEAGAWLFNAADVIAGVKMALVA